LGYNGSKFHGFQQQRKPERSKSKLMDNEREIVPELATVEGSIRRVIRFLCNCAGRTDKGVHATSQIVNFTTFKSDLTPSLILKMLHELPEHQNGDMHVYDCVRVPKSFHARSSALWRRYQYIIPLKGSDLKDVHTSEEHHMMSASSIRYLNEILRRLVDRDVGYGVYSKGKSRPSHVQMKDNSNASETTKHDDSHSSMCRILSASAFVVDLTAKTAVVSSDDMEPVTAADKYAICVELVGNRFLRQMVRKLVGTALRETFTFATDSEEYAADPEVLLKIATFSSSENVDGLVFTLPPHGLCFTGVGYDHEQLSVYKFMPKELKNHIVAKG
jgi:tRNA pseudouridine(38-40) synthase